MENENTDNGPSQYDGRGPLFTPTDKAGRKDRVRRLIEKALPGYTEYLKAKAENHEDASK